MFRVERRFPLFGPYRQCFVAFVAPEFVCHPDERAENDGAVVVRQVNNARLDDETTKLDQMLCPLTPLDLPVSHIMPRPLRLMAIARRPIAPDRSLHHRHLQVEIGMVCSETTPPRA